MNSASPKRNAYSQQKCVCHIAIHPTGMQCVQYNPLRQLPALPMLVDVKVRT